MPIAHTNPWKISILPFTSVFKVHFFLQGSFIGYVTTLRVKITKINYKFHRKICYDYKVHSLQELARAWKPLKGRNFLKFRGMSRSPIVSAQHNVCQRGMRKSLCKKCSGLEFFWKFFENAFRVKSGRSVVSFRDTWIHSRSSVR